MLPIIDYQTLLAGAALTLNRTDLADFLVICVGNATAQFNRRLRVRDMQRRSRNTVVAPDDFIDLPGDFLEIESVYPVTSPASDPLSSATYDQLRRMASERPALTTVVPSVPTHFALHGTELIVGPSVPSGTYPLELLYFASIPTLSLASPTNWLLTKAPDLYLWQTLIGTAPYLHEDERVPLWQALADRAIGELNAEFENAKLAGGRLIARRTAIA